MSKFHKLIPSKKGQVSSYDIIASIIIFSIIFLALKVIANDNITSTTRDLTYNETQIITQQAMEGLTESHGYPKEWNTLNVELIGLKKYPGVLDEEKVNAFIGMEYETVKEKLALGKYDFFITINTATQNISFGNDLNKEKVSQKRVMDFGGEKADVTLTVFR